MSDKILRLLQVNYELWGQLQSRMSSYLHHQDKIESNKMMTCVTHLWLINCFMVPTSSSSCCHSSAHAAVDQLLSRFKMTLGADLAPILAILFILLLIIFTSCLAQKFSKQQVNNQRNISELYDDYLY